MPLAPSAQKVEDWLAARGLAGRVTEMPDSTRTSAEAAATIGCTVAQIAKSLLFRGRDSGRPVLVIASGTNRVDERKVAALMGERIQRPDADYVREATGYVIGGVPPIAHAQPITTLIDADLLALDPIWAAAGTPFAVFRLTAEELVALSGGQVVELKQAAKA
ncbi:YbaK/EbsC family protein [Vineibacter terrae]|uniref:YbaK/EbsC family protein n=1 Tax=Vineibacter terrae TaxID=2586908 RepID=A0A5C8PJW0_9HYPH|nr:YbaK/EbsC family protein [Vineibacter terrae]TXL74127.1 YbaK/EbsC family protein [Vineibacter terrae]